LISIILIIPSFPIISGHSHAPLKLSPTYLPESSFNCYFLFSNCILSWSLHPRYVTLLWPGWLNFKFSFQLNFFISLFSTESSSEADLPFGSTLLDDSTALNLPDDFTFAALLSSFKIILTESSSALGLVQTISSSSLELTPMELSTLWIPISASSSTLLRSGRNLESLVGMFNSYSLQFSELSISKSHYSIFQPQ